MVAPSLDGGHTRINQNNKNAEQKADQDFNPRGFPHSTATWACHPDIHVDHSNSHEYHHRLVRNR